MAGSMCGRILFRQVCSKESASILHRSSKCSRSFTSGASKALAACERNGFKGCRLNLDGGLVMKSSFAKQFNKFESRQITRALSAMSFTTISSDGALLSGCDGEVLEGSEDSDDVCSQEPNHKRKKPL